jgi:hypothetical protein
MKRSTQVTLVLMGAVGVGSIGYALSATCRPADASAVARDAPQPAASAVARDTPQPACRSGGTHFSSYNHSSYGHGGSGFFGFGSSGTGTGTSSAGTSSTIGPSSTTRISATAPSVQRGGFGSFGRMVASFSAGG